MSGERQTPPLFLDLELRVEQKFVLESWRRQIPLLTREELQELALSMAKQLMVKDNITAQLMRGDIGGC
jgi:hypothetical protein